METPDAALEVEFISVIVEFAKLPNGHATGHVVRDSTHTRIA